MPDMRLTESEKKDFSTPSIQAPKYPMGLRISLGQEELDKIEAGEMKVEDVVKFEAEAEVVEVSVENERGDVAEKRVVLQITEMYLKKEKKDETPSTSTVLYGE